MYLFSRRLRLTAGRMLDQLDWAARMTQKVNAVSETEVQLWVPRFSEEVNTLSWITVVEDLAQLEALDAKLTADEGFVALVDEGDAFTSGEPVDDTLIRFVHRDPDAAASGDYAAVVSTIPAPGQLVASIELGVEIAQRVTSITGCPTSFGTGVTGPYGNVGWITLYQSIEQLQQAEEAVAADADFARLLDERASVVYAPGGTQTIWRKAI